VYSSAKLYVNEFCSSESHRDYSHDGLPMATYLIHHTLDTMGLVEAVSYRGLSDLSEDVKGPPKSFHGGMGLMNMQGIKKPSYHAYRMLNLLGTKLLKKEEGFLITKTLENEVRAIFYNYPVELWDTFPCSPYPYQDVSKEIEQLGDKYKVEVTIHNLKPEVTLVLEVLDKKHGDVIRRWRAMCSPSVLALYEVKELKDLSETTMKLYFTADEEGTAKLQFTLRPFAIDNLLQS
jgi:xylan 1,4-beta-xylosidase